MSCNLQFLWSMKSHFWVVIFSLLVGCTTVSGTTDQEKINGVNLVAMKQQIGKKQVEPISKLGANWVAIIPYGFTDPELCNVTYDHPRQWYGETSKGVREYVELSTQEKMEVMLKPHLWVKGQGWAGDLEFESEVEWRKWEDGYRKYILHFAAMADSLNIPLFCIGTECRKAVTKREGFWRSLIKEVRGVYNGQVTYAANWDNYDKVRFWDDLDLIGIDGYFPVCTDKTPEVNLLEKGWESVMLNLEELAEQFQKQVIFTEFGYQSIDYAADGHWKHNGDTLQVNQQGQANAYQAIFNCFWKEDWFAGGFLWKWFPTHETLGERQDKRYTPQGKLAEEVIRSFYNKRMD
ncbi:hypothetical protein V6R21_12825 [Limibacter armeniacum]|uniref:glycoside hydrolase family 113 n=1 Tax=Limibacter armeniacum TaxID=466084 RepID=UPI002FE5C82D